MIKKKSNSFLSCDRKTSVNVVIWCPDETEYDEPVAVLQICHGMIEYIDRGTCKGCTSSYSSYQENVSWYSILSCRTQHGVVCYKKIYM